MEFGARLDDLAKRCVKNLKDAGQTLVVAESCTGGLVMYSMTRIPGASAVLQGGVVTYANVMKQAVLHVPEAIIQTYGAVSQETVEGMLRGLMYLVDAHYGIAVSGIAGPSGGTPDKPVGTVWIGLQEKGMSPQIALYRFSGTRHMVQEAAAVQALQMLHEALKGNPSHV